uniref:SANT domain-containing protein n=1 Tax=Kalanchoe fedtschenkoi TaxID=63787 RepID=A0A7N0ZTD0_KALFE
MSGDSRSSSMEMTLSDIRDNMEHAADPTEECSLPGMSGEPKTCPRVGDQYQAIIPDMIPRNESTQPNAGEVVNYLLPVLPIPLMWAPNKARDAERLRALHGHADPFSEENQIFFISETGRKLTEQAEEAADNQAEVSDIRLTVDMMKLGVPSHEGSGRQLRKHEKNLYPLPGTPDGPWSDFEHDSFLLALYIFGKDLYLVKKFVETKKMDAVLSYYYGRFYKCSEYQRWAECLRSRSKKSIHGLRIFTGARQRELFSRLNSHTSEATSNKLLEVSKTFKEEGISFEEYVFTLKDLVGTELLIEVIAIGKGKRDLTGIAAEPVKLHRSVSVRREPQQDKGFSSLSCREITEQLTGSRLSKTKSNDLFWEAVWPRLLAGGWHSEQPKDHGVLTLKHQLVFLMPGIKKFRRKKHVKGQHYFDSVSDVLNKVASDPRILELDNEKEKDNGHEENHSDEQDLRLPNGKRNGYLKFCNSNPQKDQMDFMIVDTSKHRGSKVRWMETLPVHSADNSTSSSACSETGSDSSSEKSDGQGEETKATKFSKHGFDFDGEACADIHAQMGNGIGSLKKQEADSIDIKKRSSKKHRLGGKVKSGPSNYLSPFKRHPVDAACRKDSSEVAEKKTDRHVILCLPNPHKVNENKPSLKGLVEQLSPPNSLRVVSESSHFSLPNSLPEMNKENKYMVYENSKEIEEAPKQSLHHVVIDLNIPQVPEDVETNHDMIYNSTYLSSLAENTSLTHKHKDTCGRNTSSPRQTSQQAQQVSDANFEQQQPPKTHRKSQQVQKQQPKTQQEQKQQPTIQQEQQLPKTWEEQQPNNLGRRHSTRNRPLTTKALEAFESAFFETKKKRKPKENSSSRPPRRQRVNCGTNSTSDSGIVSDDMTATRVEEGPSGNSKNAPQWLIPHS